jgi:hypothetical protein
MPSVSENLEHPGKPSPLLTKRAGRRLLTLVLALTGATLVALRGAVVRPPAWVRAWLQAPASHPRRARFADASWIEAQVKQWAIRPAERMPFEKQVLTDVDRAFETAQRLNRLVFAVETHGEMLGGRV